MIDICQSRRTYNQYCRWWKRNEENEDIPDDELVHNRTASGEFYAKEATAQQDSDNIVGGVFLFDSQHVTLKTPDDCFGLESKDLVKYDGEIWIVVSVQRSKARIQHTEYASNRNCSHFWYIELRK